MRDLREGGGLDLEHLRKEILEELQRLKQRRSSLLESLEHLEALKPLALDSDGERHADSELAGIEEESAPISGPHENASEPSEMLAALRCLKCGSSLARLIPRTASGEPNLSSPLLGQSDGRQRYLECPQCLAKNVFLRTTGPAGWRLLVTQLSR